MAPQTKTAGKIKTQITRFSNRLSSGLAKPRRKFLHQMVYGIQASKDIKLTNIGRSLGEEIPLKKTENRLSRQINNGDLTEFVGRKLTGEAKYWIKDETVLALDLSDISKEYSKKQEYLALVRDGSQKGKIRKGYWTLEILGADTDGDRMIPLYGELYSQRADDFQSENKQILGAIDLVREVIGKKGIWTLDRGADRGIIFKGLLARELRFTIRLRGDRDLVLIDKRRREGRKRSSLSLTKSCRCRRRVKLNICKEGEVPKIKDLYLGSRMVKLPFSDTHLTLVVVKGYSKNPLMLLTNVEEAEDDPLSILEIYLTRWKCEESFRFIKQSYNLEDVRVQSYIALRNVVSFVMAVFFFVSVVLAVGMRLRILLKKVYEKAKRLFEIPPFKQYAICDGIYNLLWGGKFSSSKELPVSQTPQLTLPFEISPF